MARKLLLLQLLLVAVVELQGRCLLLLRRHLRLWRRLRDKDAGPATAAAAAAVVVVAAVSRGRRRRRRRRDGGQAKSVCSELLLLARRRRRRRAAAARGSSSSSRSGGEVATGLPQPQDPLYVLQLVVRERLLVLPRRRQRPRRLWLRNCGLVKVLLLLLLREALLQLLLPRARARLPQRGDGVDGCRRGRGRRGVAAAQDRQAGGRGGRGRGGALADLAAGAAGAAVGFVEGGGE